MQRKFDVTSLNSLTDFNPFQNLRMLNEQVQDVYRVCRDGGKQGVEDNLHLIHAFVNYFDIVYRYVRLTKKF